MVFILFYLNFRSNLELKRLAIQYLVLD